MHGLSRTATALSFQGTSWSALWCDALRSGEVPSVGACLTSPVRCAVTQSLLFSLAQRTRYGSGGSPSPPPPNGMRARQGVSVGAAKPPMVPPVTQHLHRVPATDRAPTPDPQGDRGCWACGRGLPHVPLVSGPRRQAFGGRVPVSKAIASVTTSFWPVSDVACAPS